LEAGHAEDLLKEVNACIPMKRSPLASEYQGVLFFLLTDALVYINGAILPIEGG
jgi:hypothetical protein